MNPHAEDLLSAYLDGELTQEERIKIDSHLTACRDCRLELESLRYMKRKLSLAPRRTMPPELIAQIEGHLSGPKLGGFIASILRPRIWIPAGAMACSVVLAGLWLGLKNSHEQDLPIEPLLTAHSRYWAESLVPQGSLVASNYSAQLTAYYSNGQDQEE